MDQDNEAFKKMGIFVGDSNGYIFNLKIMDGVGPVLVKQSKIH